MKTNISIPADTQFLNHENQQEQNLEQSNNSQTVEDCTNEETSISNASGMETNIAAEGARNMLVGALWCIGGVVVTAATYSAVKESGGTYIVAWGAILFGGIQFFRGVFQSL
jgi:hypothetical protein